MMDTAFVTGASSGIGQEIYLHLRDRGYNVCGASRHGPDQVVDYSQTSFPNPPGGPYNVVVLNHGILRLDESQENRQMVYRTNLDSYFRLLELGTALVKNGGCVLINASVAGVIAQAEIPWYSCTKAALINLTRSMAKKASFWGVRVNCFSCGFFKTDIVTGPFPEELLSRVPLGHRRAGTWEILPIVDALIDCPYITGQNIVVDGGLSL